MGTETRTAEFAGRTYRFVVYDVESVSKVPGSDRLAGLGDHWEHAANASWWTFEDEAEVRERHWHFADGDVVLDIGPAFGSYTLTAAAQGARVVAFEPCLFCRTILERNVAVNPELADRITILPLGVAERAGYFDPEAGAWLPEEVPGRQCLRADTLDNLVAVAELNVGCQNGGITHVKLDVEGAEYGAVSSGVKALQRHRPALLIEEHEFKRAGIGADVEKVLRAIGYGAPVRVGHGAVNHAFYGRP